MRTIMWIKNHRWLSSLLVGLVCLGLGGLAGLMPLRYLAGVAFCLGLTTIAYAWVWLISKPAELRGMLLLCFAAMGLRWGASFALEFLWPSFENLSDGAAYGPHAMTIAQAWNANYFASYEDVVATPVGAPGYVYFSAVIFWLFGPNTLLVKLANGLFAGMAAVYTAKLGNHFFDQRVGRFAALWMLIMPSLILWTSQNLKDSAVVLLSVWILYVASQGLRSSLWQIPLLVLLIGALMSVRRETSIGIALMIALTIGFQQTRHWLTRLILSAITIVALGLVLSSSGYGFLGSDYLQERLSLSAITEKREANSTGTGTIENTIDTTTPLGFARYLPIALINFWLRPWPWEATKSTAQLLTIPEAALLWYPLWVLAMLGMLLAWRSRWRETMLLWLYLLAGSAAAAPQYGNFGTAYRHRVQLWPIFFLFAGYCWYRWRDARAEQRQALLTRYVQSIEQQAASLQ